MNAAAAPDESRPSLLSRDWVRQNPDQAYPWMALVVLTAVLMWGYWNSLCITARGWNNPIYSHGYLVPVFALVLLWLRWERLTPVTPLARWAGLGLLTAGLSLRVLSTYYSNVFGELVSFVPSLAGIVLLVGGWSMFRWAGPAVGFLIFMFPLPSQVKETLLVNLQHVATVASTFALQTLGIAAYYEGNRITVGEMQMGVVEACSGLRMLICFIAITVGAAFIVDWGPLERLVIVLSGIPIAVAANVVRIGSTGLVQEHFGPEMASKIFHDFAGWLMMPLACLLVALELWLLNRTFPRVESGPLVAMQTTGAGHDQPGGRRVVVPDVRK